MDALLTTHSTLTAHANLSKTLADVTALITLLQTTRDSLAPPSSSPDDERTGPALLHVAKLKTPLKQAWERIEEDLKEVNKGLNGYQKAVREKFKLGNGGAAGSVGGSAGSVGEGVGGEMGSAAVFGIGAGGLESQKGLVDRAIAMHLLREGKFDVASTFVREVNASQRRNERERADEKQGGGEGERHEEDDEGMEVDVGHEHNRWVEDFADQDEEMNDGDGDGELNEELYGELGKGYLQRKFAEMYHILDALRNHQNLQPAIDWARAHSAELEEHGSTLESELTRLRFLQIYTSPATSPDAALMDALLYARTAFPLLPTRHQSSLSQLLGGLAYSPSRDTSPYATNLFLTPSPLWTSIPPHLIQSFTTLLSLPPTSPLATALTAGLLALPPLQKYSRILSATRGGQWSSTHELPVETPLEPAKKYIFHSVFVCPVSKEQTTDANPPMMLGCGHVIAKESLDGMMNKPGKSRVKCPYCPAETKLGEARRIYI